MLDDAYVNVKESQKIEQAQNLTEGASFPSPHPPKMPVHHLSNDGLKT